MPNHPPKNVTKMSRTLQKNSILRNLWDRYLRQYKDSIREVARRAGLDHTTLSRAINAGVASEPVREALIAAGIPLHLIPLPNCSTTLAGMILEARENPGCSPKI